MWDGTVITLGREKTLHQELSLTTPKPCSVVLLTTDFKLLYRGANVPLFYQGGS